MIDNLNINFKNFPEKEKTEYIEDYIISTLTQNKDLKKINDLFDEYSRNRFFYIEAKSKKDINVVYSFQR